MGGSFLFFSQHHEEILTPLKNAVLISSHHSLLVFTLSFLHFFLLLSLYLLPVPPCVFAVERYLKIIPEQSTQMDTDDRTVVQRGKEIHKVG